MKKLKKILPIVIFVIAAVVYLMKGGLLDGDKAKDPSASGLISEVIQELEDTEKEEPAESETVKESAAEEESEEEAKEESKEESKAEAKEESEEESSAKEPEKQEEAESEEDQEEGVVYGEAYNTKDEVAAYLHQFGELPPNYITKNEAKDKGWDSSKGNLWDVAYGMSIGGDKFGNYEKLLPTAKGRQYYECDIDYEGGYRGANRIIFSNDGLIYYTEDHYETFELLYGDPEA